MKIACVGYLHGSGGAERQIIMLANALSLRGHDVHLIVIAENKSKYDICEKVTVHDLSALEKGNRGSKIFTRYLGLKRVFSEIRPDISIHYWMQSAYLSVLMPKAICGKIVYSERSDPGDEEYFGLLGKVRQIAFRRIDGFVFQSEGARDYFPEPIKLRSIVIHNSVSVPKEKYGTPCTERKKKIVSVGRLHPQKNQTLLINAFSKIAADFPEYILEIYGDGELKQQLMQQIQEYGLQDKVFLRGSCKDIFDRVYSASLFVLASDYEGMPNALMEAMSLGVPCISTDCRPGGARTLIQDGVNGIIVPIGDAQDLAARMRYMLIQKAEAERMGKEAQKLALTHTQEKIFDVWEKYICSIMG